MQTGIRTPNKILNIKAAGTTFSELEEGRYNDPWSPTLEVVDEREAT